jgi:hypothetical protein
VFVVPVEVVVVLSVDESPPPHPTRNNGNTAAAAEKTNRLCTRDINFTPSQKTAETSTDAQLQTLNRAF